MKIMENRLNEKDSLTDLLTTEKDAIKLYSSAITEGSLKAIRTMWQENLMEVAEDQFMIFNEMEKRGFYAIKPAEKVDIDMEKKKFKEIKSQLK